MSGEGKPQSPCVTCAILPSRVRTAQVVADPVSADSIAFGSTVTFRRADGRVQTYRIVGEDEADPKEGSISYVSPIARLLLGKVVGDEVGAPGDCWRLFRSCDALMGRRRPRRKCCGPRSSAKSASY